MIVLHKQKFQWSTCACVFMITIGAIITSIGDVTYEFQSYFIGSLSVLCHSLYLLTIQRFSEKKNANDILYFNSLISLPMICLAMMFFSDEFVNLRTYRGYKTVDFWLYFLLSTIGGGLLNASTFWCTIKNSALTTR